MALRKEQTSIGLFDITDFFITGEDGNETQFTLTVENGSDVVGAGLYTDKGQVKLDVATLRGLHTALSEMLESEKEKSA